MPISKVTRVSSEKIWQAWARSHRATGVSCLATGSIGQMEGKSKKVTYKILEAVEGRSFSVLWKSMFVRFIFTHQVNPSSFGSEIIYDYRIEGLLAWPMRLLLRGQIRRNLSLVLTAFVTNLESNG